MGGVNIVVVGVGVNDELDVMRPAGGRVGHVDFLPVTVMVGVGSIEHAESSGRSEVTAYHANIDFHLTGFQMCSRRWASVNGNQYFFH